MERIQHCWVDIDIEVSYLSDPLVSLPNPIHHPALELLADDGEDDVANPCLGDLLQLLEDRKVLHDLGHGKGLLDDECHLQRLVLGNPQGLDVVVVDESLGTVDDVLHEVL